MSVESKGCPPTWDGWQCWPKGGVAGETQYETCPNYIFFHTGGGNILQNSCGRKSKYKISDHFINSNSPSHKFIDPLLTKRCISQGMPKNIAMSLVHG